MDGGGDDRIQEAGEALVEIGRRKVMRRLVPSGWTRTTPASRNLASDR